jgi:GntR family transcriptional regulator
VAEPAGLPGLQLDPASAVPVAAQIEAHVVGLVSSGTLPPGHRLPPVRALAATLGVAPGTVAKAYRVLEQEGFVETAGRNGTVVADQRVEASDSTRQQLRAVLQPLLDGGMSQGEILRLVRSVLGG